MRRKIYHAFATHPSTATVIYGRATSFLEPFDEKLCVSLH